MLAPSGLVRFPCARPAFLDTTMRASLSFKPFALILVAILALAGCNRQPSPNGDTEATLSYWKRLNEERPDFSDLEAASAAWAKAPGDELCKAWRSRSAVEQVQSSPFPWIAR